MTRARSLPHLLAALAASFVLSLPAHAAENCVGSWAPPLPAGLRAPSSPTVDPGSVRFSWPVGIPWGSPRLRITNYVDHDPTPRILDYTGGIYTYDGHFGTDINANSFDDMDEGVPILAAANARVVSLTDQYYDREIVAPNVPGNYVFLIHEDGTTTLYYHLRTNSVCVHIGEYVREGQMLGFMGSSGFTTEPHLHFQVQASNGQFDPFDVTNSLWKNQPDYVGDDEATFHDMGVTTFGAFLDTGGLSAWAGFKGHAAQPVILGADEPTIKMWGLFTGQLQKPYALEIHRPDGSLFAHQNFQVPTSNWGQAWQWLDIPFAGHVAPSEYGTWYEQAIVNGAVAATDSFVVGETSRYAPRFFPVGGRSFHLSSQTQYDVLQLSYLGAPAESLTFALEDAPGNVSIATDEFGSTVVTIGPPGPDLANRRSSTFAVVATDPDGRQGRMRYHLINDAAPAPDSPPVVTAPGVVSATEGDTVRVDVSASDPDGDAIAGLTAGGSLPGATFTTGPGNTQGTLKWPTRAGDRGTHSVTFVALTSVGGWSGYAPIEESSLAHTTVVVAAALSARAFTRPEDRMIRLMSQRSEWCARVEPRNGSFDPADVDPASLRLVSTGTGPGHEIAPVARRSLLVADEDRDGVPDISVCFAKEDLRRLFEDVTGKRTVTIAVEGTVRGGGSFSAPLTIDVVGEGGPRGGLAIVSLTPNPSRGAVSVSYQAVPGARARMEVFDVAGRRVREVDLGAGQGGVRSIVWDGLNRDGSRAPGGVYWLRVSSAGQRVSQRVVLLRSAQ